MADKFCGVCGENNSWLEFKTIAGISTCRYCAECSSCDAKLPSALVGLAGGNGRAKRCSKCHARDRKEFKKRTRKTVKFEKILGQSGAREFHLKTYVRLETETGRYIEFAEFNRGRRRWDGTEETYVTCGTWEIKVRGEKQFKKFTIKRTVLIESNITDRYSRRLTHLARILGYRLTGLRSDFKTIVLKVSDARTLTLAEERQSNPEKFVLEGLGGKARAEIHKLNAKREQVQEKLDEVSAFAETRVREADLGAELVS